MRHLFFLITIFVLFKTNAQNEKYGFVGGANLSNLYVNFEEIDANKARFSFHVGVFADFKITHKLKFVPQFTFSSQGSRSDGESTFPTFTFVNGNPVQGTTTIGSEGAYVFDYINLPLEFRYPVKGNFHLILGPQLGMLLNSKYKGVFIIDGIREESKTNTDLDFETQLDYGVLLGVSYDVSDKVFADLKYYRGLSNLNRNDNIYIGGDINTFNSVFQLSLGYYLF